MFAYIWKLDKLIIKISMYYLTYRTTLVLYNKESSNNLFTPIFIYYVFELMKKCNLMKKCCLMKNKYFYFFLNLYINFDLADWSL